MALGIELLLKNTRVASIRRIANKLKDRCNKAYLIITVLILTILYYIYYYNVLEYLRTTPFSEFRYPMHVDLPEIVKKVINSQPVGIDPLNSRYTYPFVLNAERKCKDEDGSPDNVFLLLLIKSRIDDFEQRHMIRRTWAREFGISSVNVRRVFLVGVAPSNKPLQHRLGVEQQDYNDIVQQYFVDSYFNNTLKMMMGFQWAMEYCDNAQFIAFLDDDYYVNINKAVRMLQQTVKPTEVAEIVVGYVWENAMPFRIRDSKWYVSLEEYPYRFWPPYVTAGSFFLPIQTAERVHAGMQYTKVIRFDDVFLGIVCWKLKIRLRHNANLYFYKKPYDVYGYRSVIASHGFKDTEELYNVWKEQTKLDSEV